MPRMRTYYDLLGLPFGASEAQVRQRYRELAKRFHPDVNPSPEAKLHMQRLNEAYRVLTTPHLRRAYHWRIAMLLARRSVRSPISPAPSLTPPLGHLSHLFAALILLLFLIAVFYHWTHPFPFRRLHLSGFGWHSLPPYLHLPPSIQRIDLSRNRLKEIPKELWRMSSLTHLDLSYNQLTTLSSQIFLFSHLEELNLSYNQLSILPLGIGELRRLRRLELQGNRLQEVPEEIFTLPHLEVLDVRQNPLAPEAQIRLRQFQERCGCQVLWTLP
ncbi:MAG: DnaJ domain-containing protein [Bacteroidia bacterium]|nr:DnaJ domain-containing protein [Bacteroidia bacterium]MDW8015175.1 DnaJ domain-containing protein [Bacteroidia bacterium]